MEWANIFEGFVVSGQIVITSVFYDMDVEWHQMSKSNQPVEYASTSFNCGYFPLQPLEHGSQGWHDAILSWECGARKNRRNLD